MTSNFACLTGYAQRYFLHTWLFSPPHGKPSKLVPALPPSPSFPAGPVAPQLAPWPFLPIVKLHLKVLADAAQNALIQSSASASNPRPFRLSPLIARSRLKHCCLPGCIAHISPNFIKAPPGLMQRKSCNLQSGDSSLLTVQLQSQPPDFHQQGVLTACKLEYCT